MRPLILITNDDGVASKGIHTLTEVASEFGDVVVMAPMLNASGKSLSLTPERPLRVKDIQNTPELSIHSCDGTPVDCVKLAVEYFCPRRPDLILAGINHGSNSSINVLYSGTMGAVIEAATLGFKSIGFSLLNHNPEADFSSCISPVRHIIGKVLEEGLPSGITLNVNIPRLSADEIKGIRICHEAKGRWLDSFAQRTDPLGRPYWWLTGKFDCNNPPEGSDEWALIHGYVSVVPVSVDFTHYESIGKLNNLAQ